MSRIAPQPWMTEPSTRALFEALGKAGIEARFVGGCVRDALLGRPIDDIADIDIATPARPETVMAALAAAGIKAVPTGIAHGTVTALVNAPGPPRHYEITTLRRDLETDGRRARVAFDADWQEDAERRDFTINAIYLDLDGSLHDPAGGLPDLAARRVRFVGDPARRIAEDRLRALRYYRFEARFGAGADGGADGGAAGSGEGDDAARAACAAAAPELRLLSPERVAGELFRLLAVPDPVRALRMMAADGVLAALLPEAARLDRLARLIPLERELEPAPEPLRRLAALIAVDPAGAEALAARLRLSNEKRERLVGLALPSDSPPSDRTTGPLAPVADDRDRHLALYRLGLQRYRDLALLAAADGGIDAGELRRLIGLAERWSPPQFPLAGHDVLALGIPPGVRVGELLAAVRRWWEEGDFTADRAACLDRLRQLAETPDAAL